MLVCSADRRPGYAHLKPVDFLLMSSLTPSPELAKEEYRRALQKIESLHGNMAVLSRIGQLLRNPNTGIDEIGRLLQTDGTLCANVIRISNSFAYGVGFKSTNINEALAKVGFNRILSLVGSTLSRQVFMKDLAAYGMTADDYWAYSYFCGLFSETRAASSGQSADEAYLVGLLHAIGRVVINELLIKTKVEVYWDALIACEEWEDLLVGVRHDHAGGILLKSWKFEVGVHQRVSDQKSPTAIAADPVLLVLDYARVCAELNHYRLDGPEWRLPADHPFTQSRDFDPEFIAADVERTRLNCRQIRDAMKPA